MKKGANPPPGSVEEWLGHAESDLNLARLACHRPDVLPQHTCFHAQQAAEKALKAIFLFCRFAFPLTHDLEELLELARLNSLVLPSELADVGELTPYAVQTRYSWRLGADHGGGSRRGHPPGRSDRLVGKDSDRQAKRGGTRMSVGFLPLAERPGPKHPTMPQTQRR